MQPLYNALTPPTLVLAGLRAALLQDVPNLSFVLDPMLDWSDAAKSQRELRDMQHGSGEAEALPDQTAAVNPTQYPLMAWKRSALVPMAERSRRNAYAATATVEVDGETWDLQVFFGQLNFGFKIFARDILELEAIEVGYVAKSLISGITGFAIPIEALYPAVDTSGIPPDVLTYDVQWDPLVPEIQFEKTPAMVFAIQGTATIRGAFITGVAGPHYPVRRIVLSIKDMDNALLDRVEVIKTSLP